MDRVPIDSRLVRVQMAALVVGVVAALLSLLGLLFDATYTQFFRSYLTGYLFALGMALGCLALLMVQHLSGGRWGQTIRRFL